MHLTAMWFTSFESEIDKRKKVDVMRLRGLQVAILYDTVSQYHKYLRYITRRSIAAEARVIQDGAHGHRERPWVFHWCADCPDRACYTIVFRGTRSCGVVADVYGGSDPRSTFQAVC